MDHQFYIPNFQPNLNLRYFPDCNSQNIYDTSTPQYHPININNGNVPYCAPTLANNMDYQHMNRMGNDQQHSRAPSVGVDAANNNSNIFSFPSRDFSEMLTDFNPSDSECITARRWINIIENLRDVYKLNDLNILYAAIRKLKGVASLWYQSVSNNIRDWGQFRCDFISEFDRSRDIADVHFALANRKKKTSETFTEYVYNVRKIASEIDLDDQTIIKYVISGLSDSDDKIKQALAIQNIQSVSELLNRLKTYENILGNKKLNKEYSNKENFKNNRVRQCYICSSENHIARDCRKKVIYCSSCKREGHYEISCPFKRNTDKYTKEPRKEEKPPNMIRMVSCENEYIKKVVIDGHGVRAFIDLGSDCVTMTESLCKSLNLKYKPHLQHLRGFGKGYSTTIGIVQVKLEIDSVEIIVDILIVPDSDQQEQLMIGRSALDQDGIVVVKGNNILKIFKTDTNGKLIINNVNGKMSANIKNNNGSSENSFFVENEKEMLNINVDFNDFNENFGFTDKFVNSLDKLDFCEERKQKLKQVLMITKNNFENINVELMEKCINQNIDERIRNQLVDLIAEFRDCFALNMNEIGKTNKASIKIRLNDFEPVSYHPYRLSPAQRENVKCHINELLLQQGIIKQSESDYASPIVVVKKKDGEDRICVDFRQLNKKTIKDRYPIPHIEDCLQKLEGAKYYTVVDLASGYYQIPVDEDSKKYTSFVTPDGQYQFERMPFGLANAPAVFQRFASKLASEVSENIVSYIDDMILPSRTIEEGIDLLRRFLNKLREYGVTLKLSKCRFMVEKVDFLGHEINRNGIRPGMDKIKCVTNFPTPTNVHQIRQFIGLASYLAESITRLTRENVKFEWTNEQTEVFKELKNKLCQRDILVLFNNNKSHEVHTDASAIGLGGILLQLEDDNEFHPVSYYSRQTTDLERKFHSFELEALAVVESLDRFRPFILGKTFTVVTDCNSLRTASSKRDIIPRIGRWWLRLQEYDFEIRHKSGSQMCHVDALSRNPVDPPRNIEPVTLDVMHVESVDQSWVEMLQDNDLDIKEIKANIANPANKEFEIKGGRLYRRVNGELLFVVPKGVRGRVIRSCHDEMGHFSKDKTLAALREVYWWPRMRQFVKKYIATCYECLFHKENREKNRITLHPIEKIPTPCHTWHLDHLGPFVRSQKGNCYVLVIVDAYTKYVYLRAVKNTKSQFVIKAVNELALHFGMPSRIISDRGSTLVDRNFESFCNEHNILHIKNATATPRANGQVERYNRTILHALRTMSDDKSEKWDEELPAIQWAMNSLPHSVTQISPQQLIFGFSPKPISKDKLKLILVDERIDNTLFDTEIRGNLRREASERIKINQDKQRERFKMKFKAPDKYNIGDKVVVFREPPATGESRKLLRRFRGPYTVTQVLYADRYRVEEDCSVDGRRRFKGTVPADHMRLVISPEYEFGETSSEFEEDD